MKLLGFGIRSDEMRKYFSVFLVAVRSTMYKIMGILILMAAAETILFWIQLKGIESGIPLSLEELVRISRISLVSGAAFLAVCCILSLVGYEMSGSRTRYTIQRLSVKEEAVVLLWALNSMIALCIFWAAQLGIVLLLSKIYIDFLEPVSFNRQTIFLAFHRSGFLHSLLPLEETSRVLRNVAMIFGLGIAAACFAQKQRQGQKGIAIMVLTALTVVTFSGDMGKLGTDIGIIAAFLAAAVFSVYSIFRTEANKE
jgi:hypothetical protein